MKLGVAVSMFYSLTGKNEMSEPMVVEYLNQGLGFAVEDVKGVQCYYTMTLRKDQSEYALPAGITKIQKVRLLDGATLKATLTPSSAQDVLGKDASGEISSGTPSACAVAYAKTASSTTPPSMVLKFDKPPSWGATSQSESNTYIELYCLVTWAYTDDKAVELGLPRSLQEAGLYRACFVATKNDAYLKLYTDSRNVHLRTGIGNEPRVQAKAGYQTGRNVDWRFPLS